MNWMRLFTLLVIFVLAGTAFSEEISTKDPRWIQLSQAYGFVLGQQSSLEMIEKKFPDLAKDVKDAWYFFHSTALGESVKGVEEELHKILVDKWPEFEKVMIAQRTLIGEQEFTRQQAIDFLQEVRKRAKGEMPESILTALLSAHPTFANNPGLELSTGWKQTFRTKGHPKAKGVDFSISFPASWSKREGYRPNIVQFFQSGAGYGPIMCSLIVRDIPLPAGYKPTENELKEFFQPNELKDMVPEGGMFIDAESIVLEGAPAGMLVIDQTMQRLDLTMTMRTTQFITIQERSMILIQFVVTKLPNSKESLDELQQKYLPTYRAIANTFVFNDKYK
jgi:hypothetical protein